MAEDGVAQAVQEGLSGLLGEGDVVGVGADVFEVFVGGVGAPARERALFDEREAVGLASHVVELLAVGLVGGEDGVVEALDLGVQRRVAVLVVADHQEHGQKPARTQQLEALAVGDILVQPLDRRGGVNEVKGVRREGIGLEIGVHDGEIRAIRVLLAHLLRQVRAQLNGGVVAAGVQREVGRLAGAGADLQAAHARAEPAGLCDVVEQRGAVARAPLVETLRDGVEHEPRVPLRHGKSLLEVHGR